MATSASSANADHSHDSSSAGTFYVDPWQEFKAVGLKLKKRFLRKPNVSEAARNYAHLAERLRDDHECCEYAALCRLSAARCFHQLGNAAAECHELREAARQFMGCEMARRNMNLPTLSNNLNTSIHCYGHAIKSFAEQRCFNQAGHVCLELGKEFLKLDRPNESIEYFEKAFKFYKSQPFDEWQALHWACVARILNHEFRSALNTIEKIKSHLKIKFLLPMPENDQKIQFYQSAKSSQQQNGYLKHYLIDLETLSVLTFCIISPENDQGLSLDEKLIRLRYFPVEACCSGINNEGKEETFPAKITQNSDEGDMEKFLLLKSFAYALYYKDFEAAQVCLTDLRPILDSPLALDLAIEACDIRKTSHLSCL